MSAHGWKANYKSPRTAPDAHLTSALERAVGRLALFLFMHLGDLLQDSNGLNMEIRLEKPSDTQFLETLRTARSPGFVGFYWTDSRILAYEGCFKYLIGCTARKDRD